MTVELKNKTTFNMFIYMNGVSIFIDNGSNSIKTVPSEEFKDIDLQRIQSKCWTIISFNIGIT